MNIHDLTGRLIYESQKGFWELEKNHVTVWDQNYSLRFYCRWQLELMMSFKHACHWQIVLANSVKCQCGIWWELVAFEEHCTSTTYTHHALADCLTIGLFLLLLSLQIAFSLSLQIVFSVVFCQLKLAGIEKMEQLSSNAKVSFDMIWARILLIFLNWYYLHGRCWIKEIVIF